MSTGRASTPPPAWLRALLWWIVIGLLVQGSTAAVVQMLGPSHRHEAAIPSASSNLLIRIDRVFREVRAWRAELRQHWLPAQAPHSHAGGVVHSHQDQVQAPTVAITALDGDAPSHGHSGFQRHHHLQSDPTVIAIEGSGGDLTADAAAQAGVGSVTLPLAVSFAWKMPMPQWRLMVWPAASSHRWADAPQSGLERPPRA